MFAADIFSTSPTLTSADTRLSAGFDAASLTAITSAEFLATARANIGGGIGSKTLNTTYSDDGTSTNVSLKYAPNFLP
jgi:hypothetical protein